MSFELTFLECRLHTQQLSPVPKRGFLLFKQNLTPNPGKGQTPDKLSTMRCAREGYLGAQWVTFSGNGGATD